MKFSSVFAVLATVATAVTATLNPIRARALTNNQRLARDATPAYGGRTGKPSAYPNRNSCNTGSAQCCKSVSSCRDPNVADMIKNYGGPTVGGDVPIGLNCYQMAGSSNTCSQQSVCCDDNSYDGTFAIGCSPISA